MPGVADEENSHSEEELSETEAPAKKEESASDFEPEEDDKDDDFEPAAKKPKAKPKPKAKKRKGGDDDDSDEDWGKRKKKPGSGKKRGGGGFTKPYKLSEELAAVVGGDVMPRHEVVKKLWAFIKERELQDPKNKQFVICDDELMKVMGVKRFKSFGMMKYLKEHFLEAA